MKKRINITASTILVAALVSFGCAKNETTRETTTKIESPTAGTIQTTEQVKTQGELSESKVETKSDAPGVGNSTTLTAETIVGTVTEYKAGKKLEVESVDKKKHTVNLDDKDLVVSVDPGIQIGSKVKLVEEKDSESKIKKVSVSMAS